MNPILATLAGNVRTARRARGLSQEKLAELSDLDPTLISRIERGLGNPALGTLLRIATALGADLSTLLRTRTAPVAAGKSNS